MSTSLVSSTISNDADRLRIAVALVTLKFKPAHQSLASYVLDLRAIFPTSKPCAPTSDGSWRDHALKLEARLEAVNGQWEEEQRKSISLEKAVIDAEEFVKKLKEQLPAVGEPDLSKSTTTSTKKTKRKKKDATPAANVQFGGSMLVDPAPATLESMMKAFGARSDLFDLSSRDSLLARYRDFEDLVTSTTTVLHKPHVLILSTAQRFLDAAIFFIQPFLHTAKRPETHLLQDKPKVDGNAFRTVHVLLDSVLRYVLSGSWTRRPKSLSLEVQELTTTFIGRLVFSLVLPGIRSFEYYSLAFLAMCTKSTKISSATLPAIPLEDLRPSLFNLVLSSVQALQTSSLTSLPISSATRIQPLETIALEAVRQLKPIVHDYSHLCLLQSESSDGNSNSRGDLQSSLLRRLSLKDTIWYLCSIAHVVFSAPPSPTTSSVSFPEGQDLLRRTIIDELSQVSASCRIKRWKGFSSSFAGKVHVEEEDAQPQVPTSEIHPQAQPHRTDPNTPKSTTMTQTEASSVMSVRRSVGAAVEQVSSVPSFSGVSPDVSMQDVANRGGTSHGECTDQQQPLQSPAVDDGTLCFGDQEQQFEDEVDDLEGVFVDVDVVDDMIMGVVERYWLWNALS
ncbi:hypothetical protein DL96DRAFT_1637490 [Flagelloscypha sp. PMI_526]|nr:hypothetical protein DL96DRAFT_1637490 [Flagelloscypha sp. PMI_526]